MNIQDDPFAETPADIAKREAELAKFDSPAEVAKRKAKQQAEFERGVRLGWWDADGNPLNVDPDEDEEAVEDELREAEQDDDGEAR